MTSDDLLIVSIIVLALALGVFAGTILWVRGRRERTDPHLAHLISDSSAGVRQAMAESLGEGNATSFSAPSLRSESNEPSPVGSV